MSLRVAGPVRVVNNFTTHLAFWAVSSGLDVDSVTVMSASSNFVNDGSVSCNDWFAILDPVTTGVSGVNVSLSWLGASNMSWWSSFSFWFFFTWFLRIQRLFLAWGLLLTTANEVDDDSDDQEQKQESADENQNPNPDSGSAIISGLIASSVGLIGISPPPPETAFCAIRGVAVIVIAVVSVGDTVVAVFVIAFCALSSNHGQFTGWLWLITTAANVFEEDGSVLDDVKQDLFLFLVGNFFHALGHGCGAQQC